MNDSPFPEPFLEQMRQQLGDEFPAFLEALTGRPVVSLRNNPAKTSKLAPSGDPVPWCHGACYLDQRPSFVRDPLIHGGAYYVQEASSMSLATIPGISDARRILDLCAAPGGKSTLIASKMKEDAILVSNEIYSTRVKVLLENISRWGDSRIIVTQNRAESFQSIPEFFDMIFIDAPCSGEGMFRKDLHAIHHWSTGTVEDCADMQKEILWAVLPSLKVGGKLIYSTCTFNPYENEAVIDWLLNGNAGEFKMVNLFPDASWGWTRGHVGEFHQDVSKAYHFYPHKVKGEGFFLACLEKTDIGNNPGTNGFPSRKKKNRKKQPERRPGSPLTAKHQEILSSFVKDFNSLSVFGDTESVRAVPMSMADDISILTNKMNVLKNGILLGKFNRDQFIPDHDLAMSGWVSDNIPSYALDLDQALRFLKRDSVSLGIEDAPKGWALVEYDGVTLGWIKVLPNRINVHLPKEWRIRAEVY